jgi:hypothetical protein
MTPLRKRMIDDMVSAGLAPNTQAAYIRGVLGLAAHYHRSPGDLGEAQVRSYLLHLRDERGVAQGTFRPYHAGIQFLYARTLDRDWALFSKKRSRHSSFARGVLARFQKPLALLQTFALLALLSG